MSPLKILKNLSSGSLHQMMPLPAGFCGGLTNYPAAKSLSEKDSWSIFGVLPLATDLLIHNNHLLHRCIRIFENQNLWLLA